MAAEISRDQLRSAGTSRDEPRSAEISRHPQRVESTAGPAAGHVVERAFLCRHDFRAAPLRRTSTLLPLSTANTATLLPLPLHGSHCPSHCPSPLPHGRRASTGATSAPRRALRRGHLAWPRAPPPSQLSVEWQLSCLRPLRPGPGAAASFALLVSGGVLALALRRRLISAEPRLNLGQARPLSDPLGSSRLISCSRPLSADLG